MQAISTTDPIAVVVPAPENTKMRDVEEGGCLIVYNTLPEAKTRELPLQRVLAGSADKVEAEMTVSATQHDLIHLTRPASPYLDLNSHTSPTLLAT